MVPTKKQAFITLQKIFFRIIPNYSELFIKAKYLNTFEQKLNLASPATFSEKMQWLKLHGRYEQYSNLVDKFEVKQIVKNLIGEKYIIPNISVIDNIDSFTLASIPDRFVIKPTHLSGEIIICKNKETLDLNSIKKIMKYWKSLDYYYFLFESTYRNIKPKILVEDLLIDGNETIRDYKFYCFNGQVKYIHVDLNRFSNHQRNIYSTNWVKQDFRYVYPSSENIIDQPNKLEEMIEVSECLSNKFPFLRVDLYLSRDEVKFGELTFFPEGGFGRFDPPEWDLKFGNLIDLQNRK